jgi:tripartite-type tricarboxylate transporter receptor subunit TctC
VRLDPLAIVLIAGVTAIAASPPTAAQTYPTKPIRLVLPFAGGSELIGRMVAARLAPVLGQQIVADPRFGAAGNIAWEAAAKAPADGYTLAVGAVPLLTNPHIYPKVGFDPLKSFALGESHPAGQHQAGVMATLRAWLPPR